MLENYINEEEIFCNKVAAELLLPKNDLVKPFYNKADIDALEESLKNVSVREDVLRPPVVEWNVSFK